MQTHFNSELLKIACDCTFRIPRKMNILHRRMACMLALLCVFIHEGSAVQAQRRLGQVDKQMQEQTLVEARNFELKSGRVFSQHKSQELTLTFGIICCIEAVILISLVFYVLRLQKETARYKQVIQAFLNEQGVSLPDDMMSDTSGNSAELLVQSSPRKPVKPKIRKTPKRELVQPAEHKPIMKERTTAMAVTTSEQFTNSPITLKTETSDSSKSVSTSDIVHTNVAPKETGLIAPKFPVPMLKVETSKQANAVTVAKTEAKQTKETLAKSQLMSSGSGLSQYGSSTHRSSSVPDKK